jgi:hypothetical protein
MGNKDIVERSNVEQPSLGRGPAKLISTSSSQSKRVQQIEKIKKDIHLPITCCSDKA